MGMTRPRLALRIVRAFSFFFFNVHVVCRVIVESFCRSANVKSTEVCVCVCAYILLRQLRTTRAIDGLAVRDTA